MVSLLCQSADSADVLFDVHAIEEGGGGGGGEQGRVGFSNLAFEYFSHYHFKGPECIDRL